ncbi:MAG: GH3 auxin-responsive promoter family protein [Alphaproteobacteria bacterium]|nr:GH3 auxin-responsive promoter family protein [Alphaproteobacteria bacterium]
MLSFALRMADLAYRQPFLRAAADPRRTQTHALMTILRANSQTTFGRAHGFAEIGSREKFRSAVPVQTYDSLEPAIRAQAVQGTPELTQDPPVFYARTSGTTGPARDFPMTAAAERSQRAAQRILAATIHRGSAFFRGRVAAFGGGYVEGHLPSGQPFGSASGQTFATTPGFLRRRFVVPSAAYGLEHALEKYHIYALTALAAADLTGLLAANPSTFQSILRHIESAAETVLRDLADGSFTIGDEPSRMATELAKGAISPSPDRARQLEKALTPGLRLDAIWPRLTGLVSWTHGNCRIALESLAPALPPGLKIIEIGYRASEFVGTINVDAETNLCLPCLKDTVFEFVEQEAWERGERDFLWLDEIEDGRRYYLFATTACGLYRYHINDIVEVAGRFRSCPGLAFVQKGSGVTNITGEKLHEAQLLEAIREARAATGVKPAFCLAVADARSAVYRLHHQIDAAPTEDLTRAFAHGLDEALARLNVEYAAKRASDRLHPVEVVMLVPGADEGLKRHLTTHGQREAQYKPPLLVDGARFDFDFAPFRWPAVA